ncbi:MULTISPECIES: DUF6585 family protein [unclassified Kitasatospora]|uniref:DUF6585 family protein n=1 Tax=unclassified Kitasatospora TaxID=2633591 RepID=UPI00341AA11E
MVKVVETTDTQITAAVAEQAQQAGLGLLRQCFLVLTKTRLFGKPREEEKLRVYHFDHGLVHEGGGLELTVFRWDEVSTVMQATVAHYSHNIYTETDFSYRFIRDDGETFTIDGKYRDPRRAKLSGGDRGTQLGRWAELGEVAAHYVAATQLSGARASLADGGELAFGDLLVSSAGLRTVKRGLVPWSDIKSISVVNGYLVVKKDGKFLSLSNTAVSRIPNYALFMMLLGRSG